MVRLKRRESSKKSNKRGTNRNRRTQSYKSSLPSIGCRSLQIGIQPNVKRVSVPHMPYEDILEASRLAEELMQGHDIAHIKSSSPNAKRYVLTFSMANKGKQATQRMYNDVNRRLVEMNSRINSPTVDGKKLYRELMDEDVYAE